MKVFVCHFNLLCVFAVTRRKTFSNVKNYGYEVIMLFQLSLLYFLTHESVRICDNFSRKH